MITNVDHIWFSEHVATYLAGGLDGDELARFESHATTCATCADELRRAQSIESRLTGLFDEAAPAAGFEDRIITRLRESAPRRIWIHPLVTRAAATAAAIALVGGVGYVATQQHSTVQQRGQQVSRLNDIQPTSTPGWTDRSSHDEDGQNVLEGKGHVEFQSNPFSGVQRDMIFARRNASTGVSNGAVRTSPFDQNDTVIMPSEEEVSAPPSAAARDGAGGQKAGVDVSKNGVAPPTAGETFKPNDFALRAPNNKFAALKVDRADLAEKLAESQDKKLKDQEVLGQPVQSIDAPQQQQAQAQEPPPPQMAPVLNSRKIIRNGQLEFEVDSFDSSLVTITKIVAEESGFVDTTNSQKLDNGKVKGTIVVRVPPDHLDALVLKLRALGDLKRQNLTAQDVSKQYSDLESELRGARAMEERLIDIIKTGKGEIKDLLAAEKELAVWRGKLEKIQGEINYYNNQIALSTLSIDLAERNISTAAAATEQENVNIGIETDEVEKSRADAINAIDEAKGRIIESELKKLDAGQLASKIVAEVPRESAGPVLDRLKQLGIVARLDIERRQSTPGGEAPASNVRVEQKPTRLIISLYNLANVAPRETTTLNLACDDVEAAYRAILSRVRETAGGRIVSSNLNRGQPDQINGTISFEVKSQDAAAVLNDIRAAGDVLRLDVTENADTANVTSAKRGFVLQLNSSLQVPPRQTNVLGVETRDVEGAFATTTTQTAQAGGRVIDSNLSKEPDGRTIARVLIDVPLSQASAVVDQIKSAGAVRVERESKNAQVPDGKLARARIELTLATPDAIVAGEHGFWNSIRNGLSTSAAGLMWSLQIIVVGLCFVVPWALVLWGAWRLFKRTRRATGAV